MIGLGIGKIRNKIFNLLVWILGEWFGFFWFEIFGLLIDVKKFNFIGFRELYEMINVIVYLF